MRGTICYKWSKHKRDGGVYSAQGILHWKMNTGGTYQSTFRSRSGEKKQIGYITESILRERSTINSLKMKLNSLECRCSSDVALTCLKMGRFDKFKGKTPDDIDQLALILSMST